MLPPFIIEQIRKREEEAARRKEQPRLELPLDLPLERMPSGPHHDEPEDEPERGVIVVDLGSGMNLVDLG